MILFPRTHTRTHVHTGLRRSMRSTGLLLFWEGWIGVDVCLGVWMCISGYPWDLVAAAAAALAMTYLSS